MCLEEGLQPDMNKLDADTYMKISITSQIWTQITYIYFLNQIQVRIRIVKRKKIKYRYKELMGK